MDELEVEEGSKLAVESHEVHEDIVNVSEISQKPLKLEVSLTSDGSSTLAQTDDNNPLFSFLESLSLPF